ncbi:MAG: thioredoxin domain-containing protein [Vicinamibacterales bacterium]
MAGLFAVIVGAACGQPAPANISVSRIDGARVDSPPQHTNRLIAEKSPYLQQHAHNPVDWYPWGTEAFDKARREDKAIFLSIGYSTCHWCHVMETESFSNPGIAAFMNQHFVSIKVDREERPDLDRVYMNYVIGVSEGGWPMSLFLTPELEPFFGANYLPPDDRDGELGFRTVLHRVAALWETRRSDALRAAAEGTQALKARSQATRDASASADADSLDRAYQDISASFDAAAGGFGGAPKFPRPVLLNFLLRYHARTGVQRALDMTLQTLRGMARGGLHDHLGGGFHRYSTDRLWHVPHFEKMLYDQAQLAFAYVDAFQATGDPFFRDVARDTLDYVLRDMRDAGGGFFSAEDADSRIDASTSTTAEGAFYVWTTDEIRRLLGSDADLFAYHYGIETGGNVPGAQDSQGELRGKNVLSERHAVVDTAARFKTSEQDVRARLDAARRRLSDARASRPRPPRDDKVLVAWNGLMLSALARAAQVFDEPAYRDAAAAAARFVETRLYDPKSGSLERRYRQGDADIDALLEDYAFLVQGLLDLYEASFDARWLSWAVRLQATQDVSFWDDAEGGYFSTGARAPHVLARVKEEYDGAEPSANSVSAMNLLRLWQLTERPEWRARADATFRALSARLARSPSALPQLLVALDFARSRQKQIVIAGDPDAEDTRALSRVVHQRFIPNKILVLAEGGAAQARLTSLVPFIDGKAQREGRATIYICENYVCRLPTTDPRVAGRLLDGNN